MKTVSVFRAGLIVALIAVTAASGGCKHKKKSDLNTGLGTTTATTGGVEKTGGEGLPDINETTLFQKDRGLQVVYFDYDSSALTSSAMETLRQNADKIKLVPNVMIQIEGHCDERGSQEYNMALGERRALAVREFLMNLGVSGDRMVTISYGEEKPSVDGHDESAWSQNRRAEFNRAM